MVINQTWSERRVPAEIAGKSRPAHDLLLGFTRQVENMHCIYLLRLNNNTVYTRSSDDLKRRIKEHNRGKVSSTRNKLPADLIYYESYADKRDAVNRELYLKTGDGRREIRKQLKYSLQKNIIDM
ncbi:MAG: GIY-YIG nuclease family protein [Elusimicrobia bacterium]|nr:GIY-YIG nuclease family protein [Elusimicrobiota bacterium]